MEDQEVLKKYWDIISHHKKYAILQDDVGRIKVMEGTEDELPLGTIVPENEHLISLYELDPEMKKEILSEIRKTE